LHFDALYQPSILDRVDLQGDVAAVDARLHQGRPNRLRQWLPGAKSSASARWSPRADAASKAVIQDSAVSRAVSCADWASLSSIVVLSCGRSRWLYLTTGWEAAQRKALQGDTAFLPRRRSGDLKAEKCMTKEAMFWKPCLV
jgi:hypothetical protein